MSKKRYPIISIFVAVVWAVFFYPADRAPTKPEGLKMPSGSPPNGEATRNGKQLRQWSSQETMALNAK
jgi:hypothetical protein